MSLKKIYYSENFGLKSFWEVQETEVGKINLIVGKNSTGKSRFLNLTNAIAAFLTGSLKGFANVEYKIEVEINNKTFNYEINFKDNVIVFETLHVNREIKFQRNKDGTGFIVYEDEDERINLKIPSNLSVAVNKIDELQHPYLVELKAWATSFIYVPFSGELGKNSLVQLVDYDNFYDSLGPHAYKNVNNIIEVYTAGFKAFDVDFDKAIIRDMEQLGYHLDEVGIDNIQPMINFPSPALGLITTEHDLGFKIPHIYLSQGMFRALALIIHLNICLFSREKKTLLIDDIGEGLDFGRSEAIIELIINKCEEYDIQLLMTSNDRFIMNNVNLKYWTVLHREKNIVKPFNISNSQEKFNEFKYIGLNNFDFFASDYVLQENNND